MMVLHKRPIGIVLVLAACASPSFGRAPDKSEQVSLIRLLAQPESYEGKLVEVTGFVNLEFEGNAIWLHKEDFSNQIHANSIWLDVSKCVDPSGKPMSGYASLIGRFTTKRHGHMGLWSAQISQIGECFPLPAARVDA